MEQAYRGSVLQLLGSMPFPPFRQRADGTSQPSVEFILCLVRTSVDHSLVVVDLH
uniref:Uncharacterized protein n=1 Tax=Cucumis melo TaxID=3656 RepID=A0A9I9EF09_CUCME